MHEVLDLLDEQFQDKRTKQRLIKSLPVMCSTLQSLKRGAVREGEFVGTFNRMTVFFPALLSKLVEEQRFAIGEAVRDICALCVDIHAREQIIEENKPLLLKMLER